MLVGPQEEEAEPGVEGVDGDDQQQADDVPRLVGHRVGAQVQVDLGGRRGQAWGMLPARPRPPASGRKQSQPPLSGRCAPGMCI